MRALHKDAYDGGNIKIDNSVQDCSNAYSVKDKGNTNNETRIFWSKK